MGGVTLVRGARLCWTSGVGGLGCAGLAGVALDGAGFGATCLLEADVFGLFGLDSLGTATSGSVAAVPAVSALYCG